MAALEGFHLAGFGARGLERLAAPLALGVLGMFAVISLALLFLGKDQVLPAPDLASDSVREVQSSHAPLFEATYGVADDVALASAQTQRKLGSSLNWVTRIGTMWQAERQNETLRQELRARAVELERWRAIATTQSDRIGRYESLLRLKDQGGEEGFPAEAVFVTGGRFSRSFLANAGANAGLRRGDVATTERGLAGRIVAVGRRSSRILALTDPLSRAPIISSDRRVQAVLVGDNTPYPRLDFVTDSDALIEGQSWSTSGLGGVFPRGIATGTSFRDKSGRWRLRLSINPGAVEFVRILRARPIPAPEKPEEFAPNANELREYETPTGQVPRSGVNPANVAGARGAAALGTNGTTLIATKPATPKPTAPKPVSSNSVPAVSVPASSGLSSANAGQNAAPAADTDRARATNAAPAGSTDAQRPDEPQPNASNP